MSSTQQEVIKETINYVQQALVAAEGGHDWYHIERVHRMARDIANGMEVDHFVVEMAALLHDIADSKFYDGDEEIGPATARSWMESQSCAVSQIEHVVAIIENVSYKGGKQARTHSSLELDIVQDADRLDAIGAIGIARTFNYGGYRERALYDPKIPPNTNMSKEEYKSSTAPTINHFYEKLLLLKDMMNTDRGRQLAEYRHQYMLDFLQRFYYEWHGDAHAGWKLG